MTLTLVITGAIACVFLSAFFSAAEMAYSSCNTIRLEHLRDGGDRRAAAASRIVERFDDALSAILIGNNLVNIAASSLCSVLVILLTGSDEKTWLATAAVTLLIIIFGESIPKITAKKNANRLALRDAYAVRALMLLLYPLIRLVVWIIALLTRRLKDESAGDQEEAVEELQSLIETAEGEAVLGEDQSELVQAAIDFSEISAGQVMTARVDVQAIDIDDDWEKILALIEDAPYSRLPVYEGSIDNIIGVLYLNHFLKAMTDEERPDIRALLMPPCYVYKTMKLPAVLNALRRAKQHLAIVSDEYGGTLGVLSMEDVLEQIVGEIWDETDTVEQEVIQRSEDEYELGGDMILEDMCQLLALDEDSLQADSDTVGGWTLERFGAFPQPGDAFRFRGFELQVLAMDGRRVERVLLRRLREDDSEDEA